jgi:tetratricopeptide (TPR) repeat protein
MNSLEEYIIKIKSELNVTIFSPQFIRLANLYFINEQYDECISICTIGLKIFPDYLTAKLLLLKALIKLEYINEADKLYTEIRIKIPNKDLVMQLERSISEIKEKPGQERLFYPNKINTTIEYNAYKNKIDEINKDSIKNIDLDEFVDSDFFIPKDLENAFENFCNEYGSFKFDLNENQLIKPENKSRKENGSQTTPGSFLSKINIVSETIADIYAKQGYLKEAFDAYNMLIENNHPNNRRIQEKLYELERNMVNGKKI